jgi:hypothetical protein
MRLGLRSASPLVWALEAFGVLPSPLIVAFWGMESSRALIAAVELGRPPSPWTWATTRSASKHCSTP